MVKCAFCGRDELPMYGVHLITNIGTIEYFCSSKCRKNALKLKRDKRKLKWTEAHREARKKIQVKEEARVASASQTAKALEEKPVKSDKNIKKAN